MKIGIVTTWFPSGAGYVSKAYEKSLAASNKVFIYARGGQNRKNDPEWDLFNVCWAPSSYNGINTKHFIKWAKKLNLDVILFNEQRYWEPLIVAKKNGFCIGAYIDYYTSDTIKAFKIYDFVLCNTKRHYSAFDWHSNSYYIPWGTDVRKFQPRVVTKKTRTFIVSAGWQGKYQGDRRGSLLAMKAFKKVKGNCRLLIYSQVPFNDCRDEWKELITEDNRITFIYGTFDPFPYYQGDVFIYPSRLDGIGLTLAEAISSGLPSITTNSPPMNEFVREGVSGKLVDVDHYLGRNDGYYWAQSICNVRSLQNAIQYFVNIDNQSLQKFKDSTRHFAEVNLDWKNNARDINNIFKQELIKHNDSKESLSSELIHTLRRLDRIFKPSILIEFSQFARSIFSYLKTKF